MSTVYDMVLSSGYLAFARQTGFLDAVETHGLRVDAVCGTSSGALAGAMWAAGMSSSQIAAEFQTMRPIDILVPNWTLSGGVAMFRLDALIARLRQLVPATFEELPRPLGIGVITLDQKPRLLTSGPLPEAVAASCAIPWLFAPIRIGETWFADGGTVNRTFVPMFRAWRGERPMVVHLVERSLGGEAGDLTGLAVVKTARAGAGLRGLGNFVVEKEEARAAADPVIRLLSGG